MQRMAAAPEAELAQAGDILRRTRDAIGFVPETLRVMARNPAMLETWSGLMAEVYRKPDGIPLDLKRLIAHTVSREAGCAYSMAHTAHAAAEAGVAPDKIRAVFDCEGSPLFSDAERAALVVARGAGMNPNAVTDAQFAVLREHFSIPQAVEIVAVIALFGFLNRYQATLALTLEPEPRAFAEEHLAPIGWTAGRHG